MKTIVVLSLEAWDDIWRRNQHLIDRMLRSDEDLRMLFVEPSRDPLHEIHRGRRPRRGRGTRRVPGYDGRLMALEPTKWLPRAVPGGRGALHRPVARALRALRWAPDALWVNDPAWADLALRTSVPVLYDITDDWVQARRGPRQSAKTAADDAILLIVSDAVVVCSPALARVKGRVRPVTLIPNAVDLEAYQRSPARPRDLPSGPLALYAGTLHEDRLDLELVSETARRLHEQGASLVLVGPIALQAAPRQALIAQPGVHLLGPREHGRIPGYLTAADVLIVPHVVTSFTDSLDPIKLYEYLAAGRPIVSTPVAGFRDHEAVEVRSGADFADAVATLALAGLPARTNLDIPSWDERAEAFAEVLAGVLANARKARR